MITIEIQYDLFRKNKLPGSKTSYHGMITLAALSILEFVEGVDNSQWNEQSLNTNPAF